MALAFPAMLSPFSNMHAATQSAEPSGQNTGESNPDIDPAQRLRELIKNAEMELGRLFSNLRTPEGKQHALQQAKADGSSIDDLFFSLIESRLNKFCHTKSLRGLEYLSTTPTRLQKENGKITPRSEVRFCVTILQENIVFNNQIFEGAKIEQ